MFIQTSGGPERTEGVQHHQDVSPRQSPSFTEMLNWSFNYTDISLGCKLTRYRSHTHTHVPCVCVCVFRQVLSAPPLVPLNMKPLTERQLFL